MQIIYYRRHTATILRDYLECEFNDKKKDYSLEQYYCKERIEKVPHLIHNVLLMGS